MGAVVRRARTRWAVIWMEDVEKWRSKVDNETVQQAPIGRTYALS